MSHQVRAWAVLSTALLAALILWRVIPHRSAAAVHAARAATMRSILHDYDHDRAVADGDAPSGHDETPAWPDDTPAAVATRYRALVAIQRRLHAVRVDTLSEEDRLDHDLLAWRVDLDVEGHRFDEERLPFSSDDGFFVTPIYEAEATLIHDEKDGRAWIARMKALPSFYDVEIANMRRGIATGWVSARITALTALRMTRAAADAPPEQDPLMGPFAQLPDGIAPAVQASLRAAALAAMRDQVKPAQRKVARFFETEYLPRSLEAIGVSARPDGRAYYAYRVRHETTTTMTPDQVFTLGQSEVARIRRAMEAQIRASGFTGDFAAFQHFLRTDPQFYVTTREALLEKASRLAKRVDDQLPRFFGRLPRLTYGVRPVPRELEEGYTSGRNDPGDPEHGIAAGLMINTSHLDQRPLYELPALVAHEGAPGHYVQISLAQELTGLPEFRTQSDITAYVEGWAVYSEQLASEMGLYTTPYERFGLLSFEMWRACRLVMDVGIHWKGWSRDQALACLRDNTALAEKNMQNETDRYIAAPGQALGYKIGQLKLLQLRRRAEATLGERFDLRRFHDELLDSGAMPLAILESRVDGWITAQQHPGSPHDGSARPAAPAGG